MEGLDIDVGGGLRRGPPQSRLQSSVAKKDGTFQEAIQNDDFDMVQLLLEADVDVNTSCRGYLNPEDTVTPLQLTLEFMNEDYDTPYLNATRIAEVLLNEGADPNPPYYIYDWTPLHVAVAHRDQAQAYDLVQLLLIRGASVNAPISNYMSKTVLQLAVQQ